MTADLIAENARLRAALLEAKREICDYLQDGSGTLALEMAIETIDAALATPAPDAVQDAAKVPEVALAAIERAAYERGVRDAAKACDWGDIYGDNAVRSILALLTQEGR